MTASRRRGQVPLSGVDEVSDEALVLIPADPTTQDVGGVMRWHHRPPTARQLCAAGIIIHSIVPLTGYGLNRRHAESDDHRPGVDADVAPEARRAGAYGFGRRCSDWLDEVERSTRDRVDDEYVAAVQSGVGNGVP
jgi:hypothetical protein